MHNDFPGPHPVQFQGSAWARRVLAWLGWQYFFDGLPGRQGVVIAYPHTSNWDFCIAMLVKAAMGIQIHFWAKHSLFGIPLLGPLIRRLGGVPIDRRSPAGVVEDSVAQLQQARAADRLFWIGLAPEGTRAYQPGWRTGFYRLASQAGVPLGVATIDYRRREVRLQHFLRLSGDETVDYARIQAIVEGACGFNPAQAAPVRPLRTPGTFQEKA
jgi:1-acyl-sn-glycerol-3-phosphate acyltransferase